MMKSALILLISASCLALTAQAAQPAKAAAPAAAPAAQPNVPMSTVLQNLKMNGYEIVSKVELDNGVYNIDALTPQGKELSISMNAKTGEITSPKQNPAPHVSLQDAVKRVEGSGYHDVSMVDYSSGKYVIKAMDQKNTKTKLKVNGDTGEITKAWF